MTGSPPELPSIQAKNGRLLLGIRVAPGAARTAVRGLYGDRLKVAVGAPPERGRANELLVEALGEWLGVGAGNVRIQSGHSGRDKVVAFSGIEEAELRDRLDELLKGGGSADKGQDHGS